MEADMSMQQILSDVLRLVENAGISFGFIKGTGLGAVLLTIIAIAYLSRNRMPANTLIELVKALRSKKLPTQEAEKGAEEKAL